MKERRALVLPNLFIDEIKQCKLPELQTSEFLSSWSKESFLSVVCGFAIRGCKLCFRRKYCLNKEIGLPEIIEMRILIALAELGESLYLKMQMQIKYSFKGAVVGEGQKFYLFLHSTLMYHMKYSPLASS